MADAGDLPEDLPGDLWSESDLIAVDDLVPHPRNYVTHPEDELDHIRESIRRHGFYKNVVLARGNVILAGHGVVEAARGMGLTRVPFRRLDVEPDSTEALAVVVGDNEIGHLREVDDRVLTDLLKEIKDSSADSALALLGTGFSGEALAALAMVTRPAAEILDKDDAAEWAGLPEYEESSPVFRVTFLCTSEEDQQSLLDQVGATDKTQVYVRDKVKSRDLRIRWPLRESLDDWRSVKFRRDAEGDPRG